MEDNFEAVFKEMSSNVDTSTETYARCETNELRNRGHSGSDSKEFNGVHTSRNNDIDLKMKI